MIFLLIKFLLVVAIHISIFSFYPDTGAYGDVYLWISIVLWTVFFIYSSTGFKFIKNLLFPLSYLLNLAFYLVMIFFIALTMPQTEGGPVIAKVFRGDFPDKETINRGRIKYINTILFKNSFKKGQALKKAEEILDKNFGGDK